MSDDSQFVRAPNTTIPLTRSQVIEYSKCADPINGYRYFMENYFFIQHPTKGQIKYKPFPFQIKLIENYHSKRFSISMLSRQTGKCVSSETDINIRNDKTGKIYKLPIELYYEFMRSQKNNVPGPDISAFEVKDV